MATAIEIKEAAAILRSGDLVAFPTETVYGLGADADNEAAVRKILPPRTAGGPSGDCASRG
jgi:tRNA A37 threonylcarbamoyladenosine synthetase subunit TsaC/SUA5/YrdC